jgi:hypothetical protein
MVDDRGGIAMLAERVAALMGDPENVLLARSILGTSDPMEIAHSVDEFVLRHTARRVRDCSLCEFSVNAVLGLGLEDGQRIFAKIHPPSRGIDALSAIYRVQHGLHRKGFPCPDVLVLPAPFGMGAAVIQEFVDTGEYRDAHQPDVRRPMAELLATLVREAGEFSSIPGLPRSRLPLSTLWPVPHNALFDFAKTASGAEWIDRIASRAKVTLANNTWRHCGRPL